MAASRPVFPFEEALAVARELAGLAQFVGRQGGNRTTARGEFQATWLGGHADTFDATHAPPEDTERDTATAELLSNAQEWATQWALAVNDTNEIVREEAQEEAERMNADRQSAWGYAIRSYYAMAQEAAMNGRVFYGSPPLQPAAIIVDPLPDNVTAPSAPGFYGTNTPFVAYQYDGAARMVASTVGSPPA